MSVISIVLLSSLSLSLSQSSWSLSFLLSWLSSSSLLTACQHAVDHDVGQGIASLTPRPHTLGVVLHLCVPLLRSYPILGLWISNTYMRKMQKIVRNRFDWLAPLWQVSSMKLWVCMCVWVSDYVHESVRLRVSVHVSGVRVCTCMRVLVTAQLAVTKRFNLCGVRSFCFSLPFYAAGFTVFSP